MSVCGCEPKRQRPIAILEADSGVTGGIARIRNVSNWNETEWANTRLRQVRWFIFKNGYLVTSTPFTPYLAKIDFAGAVHTPSVSNGEKLNFEDALTDVITYLESKYLTTVAPNDRLEIGLVVVNGNGEKSEMSNLIILPRGIMEACCDGLDNYTFVVNNTDHCALVTVGGLDYCLIKPT